MKVRYDPSVGAAYIALLSDDDVSSFGFTYACDPQQVRGQIHLDFDVSGRLTGIEVLQASKILPSSLLNEYELKKRENLSCPCCRSTALTTRGKYEICNKCGWEDDPVQAENPDLAGGANALSLNQAREKWQSHQSNFLAARLNGTENRPKMPGNLANVG
jgi:uncharacterized protein YuzE